jgi:hypothetical protein
MNDAETPLAPPLNDEQPPPDAGEPQGSRDPERPAMLGKRFAQTIAGGMLVGLALALCAHAVLVEMWYGHVSSWSWFLVGLGGLAVGGAVALFVYGTATDRTDTGPQPRGRADVSERGEWRRSRRSAPR